MRTFGLGGDSEVALEDGGLGPRILLGPRRAGAAGARRHCAWRGGASPSWSGSCARPIPAAWTAASPSAPACRSGWPPASAPPKPSSTRRSATTPLPLDRLLTSTAQNATLNRLVARGLVHVSGFTPSDAAHVLGRQSNWNAAAARLGAELFARKRDGRGQPIAPSPEAICRARAGRAHPLVGRGDPRNRLRRGRARRRGDGRACAGAARGRRHATASPG